MDLGSLRCMLDADPAVHVQKHPFRMIPRGYGLNDNRAALQEECGEHEGGFYLCTGHWNMIVDWLDSAAGELHGKVPLGHPDGGAVVVQRGHHTLHGSGAQRGISRQHSPFPRAAQQTDEKACRGARIPAVDLGKLLFDLFHEPDDAPPRNVDLLSPAFDMHAHTPEGQNCALHIPGRGQPPDPACSRSEAAKHHSAVRYGFVAGHADRGSECLSPLHKGVHG